MTSLVFNISTKNIWIVIRLATDLMLIADPPHVNTA